MRGWKKRGEIIDRWFGGRTSGQVCFSSGVHRAFNLAVSDASLSWLRDGFVESGGRRSLEIDLAGLSGRSADSVQTTYSLAARLAPLSGLPG